MKRFLALLLIMLPALAYAQSSPNLIYGQVPTPAQWNAFFTQKQDVLAYIPANKAGDVFLGKVSLPASSTLTATFNIPQGSAPSTPINGDIWTTPSGVFAWINGGSVQLGLVSGFSPGGSSGQIQYNNSGNFGGVTAMSGDCTETVPGGVITCLKTNGTNFGSAATQSLSYPIASSLGGTGVNNSTNTISLSENLSATGGFSLQLNTTAITDATFPSGTNTLASISAQDQLVTGGANVTPYTIAWPGIGNTAQLDCGKGPLQYIFNQGNFNIEAPNGNGANSDSACIIAVINASGTSASAGTPTLLNFSPSAGSGYAFSNALTKSAVSVTFTNATPTVITWTAHGLSQNSPVYFTAGAMPSGISQYQVYYATAITTNTFEISATPSSSASYATLGASSTGTTVLGYEPSVWLFSIQQINGLANGNWLQIQ